MRVLYLLLLFVIEYAQAQQYLLSDQIKIEGTSSGELMNSHGNLSQLKVYLGDSLIEK